MRLWDVKKIINLIRCNGVQVVDSGGSVHLECRATLGPLESRAVKTLRVRMKENYFFSMSAATGACKESYYANMR